MKAVALNYNKYLNEINIAGDGRANQIISLTALHILFAREHNRVADILTNLNPRWSDEVTFYETQRIVAAELQHIVYNEWLPELIGSETMQRFSLNVHDNEYSNDYDAEINACITSEFSTAAQRFGHSTVDGKFLYVMFFSPLRPTNVWDFSVIEFQVFVFLSFVEFTKAAKSTK